MRITFVGDIMCELPLLHAAKKEGKYDFSQVFSGTKELFENSDLVVGNLETPVAGRKAGYTKDLYSFNTPAEFLDALKTSNIDVVQTANNHCLDRGKAGLLKTMEELDKRNIPYFGTSSHPNEDSRFLIKSVDEVKVALLGYTLTTNYSRNGVYIAEEDGNLVNLMMPVYGDVYGHKANTREKSNLLKNVPDRWKLSAKKLLGRNVRVVRTDQMTDETKKMLYMDLIKKDVTAAKQEADIVLCCVHGGGQFNIEPGPLMNYIVDELSKTGVDAVICSHPHVIQEIRQVNGIPCVFSLGNYSMSPSSPYLVNENLPEYGMAVHLDIERGKIAGMSYTLLHITEKNDGMLNVNPCNIGTENQSNLSEKEKTNLQTINKRIGM